MSTSNLGALPGRLTSLRDFTNLRPLLGSLDDRLARLRVQAFVLAIVDIFERAPLLNELEINVNEKDDGFLNFSVPLETEDYSPGGVDLERAVGDSSAVGEEANLTVSQLDAFTNLTPLGREDLADQLKIAYETALTPAQRLGNGDWAMFWEAARPRN